MKNPRVDEIVSQLRSISEDLGDIAISELRGALANGGDAKAEEKALMQARRAVEKAAFVLSRD